MQIFEKQIIFVEKKRMLADFSIPRLSNDIQIAIQKNHLGGQFCTEVQPLTGLELGLGFIFGLKILF